MKSRWERTAAELTLYGYVAKTWRDGAAWRWLVRRGGGTGHDAHGITGREANARAAAKRWILAQRDAKAAYAIETMGHWNGEPFEGGSHSSFRNHEGSTRFKGACGAETGWSSNYPGQRAKINCPRCMERLAAGEQQKAQAAP